MSPLEAKLEKRVQRLPNNMREVAKEDALSNIYKLFGVVEGREPRFNAYFVIENEHNRLMHEYFMQELNLPPELPESPDDFRFSDVLTLDETTLSRQFHVDSAGSLVAVWYVAGELRDILVSSQQ